MSKAVKKLVVRRPALQYQNLAKMLREQDRGKTPVSEAYAVLASATESADKNPFGFRLALGQLLRRIAERTGRQQEMATRLEGAQLSDEATAQALIDFLVQQEDRGRYNTTLVDACKIAGEALRAHARLPEIKWNVRYKYATPPNLARRIPAPS